MGLSGSAGVEDAASPGFAASPPGAIGVGAAGCTTGAGSTTGGTVSAAALGAGADSSTGFDAGSPAGFGGVAASGFSDWIGASSAGTIEGAVGGSPLPVGAGVTNGEADDAGGAGASIDVLDGSVVGVISDTADGTVPVYGPDDGAGEPTTPPQFPPMHGSGKSSHVSQCVQPVEPIAMATAVSARLNRNIPVSFP